MYLDKKNIGESYVIFTNNKIKENLFLQIVATISLLIILIATGLIFIAITCWVIFMIIAFPFAIKYERKIGKFVFSRFAKHVILGPFFIYKYTKSTTN